MPTIHIIASGDKSLEPLVDGENSMQVVRKREGSRRLGPDDRTPEHRLKHLLQSHDNH
jgi:hypothetical protein